MVKDAKQLASILTKNKDKFEVVFRYFEKENHATILHNSLYGAFITEFPYKEPK